MIFATLIVISSLAALASGDQSSQGGVIANIPGGQTATAALASSVDGMSRYLAPDGPIQPAITAIGGAPLRGAELANRGITRISSGLNQGAQSLSRSAGQAGEISMPGMQALESAMPAQVAQLGGMLQGAIQQKNQFIMGQAERAVQSGERLRSMMQNGLQGSLSQGSGRMVNAAGMLSSAQDALARSGSQIQSQLKQSLDGHMGRLQGVQGIGENVRNQAQGISRTLSNGLSGTVQQLQRTGEQVRGQIQNGLQQNSRAMSGIMGSMQGSMGNLGQTAQQNIQSVIRQAQDAAHQVTSQIQQAASGTVNRLQSLGSGLSSGLGNVMQSGGQSSGKY